MKFKYFISISPKASCLPSVSLHSAGKLIKSTIRSSEASPFWTIVTNEPNEINGPIISIIKALIVTNSPTVICPSTANEPHIYILILIQIKGAIMVKGDKIASRMATLILSE